MSRSIKLKLITLLLASLLVACSNETTKVDEKESTRSEGAEMTALNNLDETLYAKVHYPKTHKGDVVDTYFGTQVADPYRWLEDDRSKQTEEWVKQQNKVTFSYLETKSR